MYSTAPFSQVKFLLTNRFILVLYIFRLTGNNSRAIYNISVFSVKLFEQNVLFCSVLFCDSQPKVMLHSSVEIMFFRTVGEFGPWSSQIYLVIDLVINTLLFTMLRNLFFPILSFCTPGYARNPRWTKLSV